MWNIWKIKIRNINVINRIKKFKKKTRNNMKEKSKLIRDWTKTIFKQCKEWNNEQRN